MRGFLKFSAKSYRVLLFLYPPNLRDEFGDEMTWVFAEELACAWQQRHRVFRVLQVWFCALAEVISIAFPSWIANPAIIAPLAAFGMSKLTMGLLPSLASGAIALAAVKYVRRAPQSYPFFPRPNAY
jgi:hypothetical protein